MQEYWPWWLGALGLAGISVLYLFLIGRLLGVSGSWAKVVAWKESRNAAATREQYASNQDEMNDAFMAETLAEFGEEALQELQLTAAEPATADNPLDNNSQHESNAPWTAHLTFLVSMFIGAFVVAWFSGDFQLRLDLSDVHSRIFGEIWEVWLALLFGGIMVGFGTQMAGGVPQVMA